MRALIDDCGEEKLWDFLSVYMTSPSMMYMVYVYCVIVYKSLDGLLHTPIVNEC